MKKRYSKIVAFVSLLLFLILILSPLAGAGEIYDSMIRLHVLAHSDSSEDQADKLAVRDRILDYAKEHFSSFESREEAEKAIKTKLQHLTSIAEEELRLRGRARPVTVTLTRETYPTRHYEDLSLPAGEYLSLRVMIGEASGENWWCVLFPPVCLDTARKTEDALLESGMDRETVKTVTVREGEYAIRFRMVELFQAAKRALSSLFRF